jgi:hypothetical protein
MPQFVELYLVTPTGVYTATPAGVVVEVGPQVPTLQCVVYRTGGTANFVWHRTIALTPDEAQEALEEVKSMGYHAFLENFFLSLAVGLPETFSLDFPLEKDWC